MNTMRKWIFILAAIIFAGALFADKIVNFYIDWIWFDSHQFGAVFWTIVGSQLGIGLLLGLVFFAFTYVPLRIVYGKTEHLPVVLSDEIRRDLPLLDLVAANLKGLLLLGPALLALMTGIVVGQKWELLLKFLNAVPFGQVDPVFGMDYSFYLFSLPFLELLKSLVWEVLIVLGIGVGLIFFFKRYLYLGPTGFVLLPDARRTMAVLLGCFFLAAAMEFHLARYNLLMAGSGVVAGISYADDYGRLPFLTLMAFLSLAGGLFSFLVPRDKGMKKIFLTAVGLGIIYIVGNFYPKILQRFVVDPNELVKETPYIEHTISGTLLAYGLDNVETNVLTGDEPLSAGLIKKNKVTIDNIRLWDQEPLLDTLGQIQEIRTYYQFNSVDNDRYTIDGIYRQTLLSPRELLSTSLPNRTWINEHLTFTHGYGVSLSPVNQITPEGLPVLFIKDIPPQSAVDLKITRPEIYFGELSSDHVFVNTKTKEFSYPEGEKNVYKNYQGQGGFAVESFFKKILLAMRFKTLKILLSNDIHNESRVLMYRNIRDRVLKTAPFLRLDSDPYLVISDGRLQWLYDGYVVSDKFPYSHMISRFGNYVRNSVKVSIDAYNGTMEFYISDPEDPVILTYRNIFPTLFKDMEEMPKDLKSHIRYPSDLFSIQTFIYATYHMKTPQVFYNKEDQWEIPEIDRKRMEPYYTIMKLPSKEHEEYILMLPFTPRGKSNLSAWMVARSDDEHYGNLVAYTFPKQKLVYGPSQIVARINQDAEISRQISLWDQRGSNVIQGTLLVIPIEESLIYVRPLYLKADAGKIPELKRVIVGYEDNIAMEKTLDEALEKIFSGLQLKRPSGQEAVARAEPPGKPTASESKVVLKPSEYQKIRDYFERAQAKQRALDKALADYRKEFEALGKALDSASVEKNAVVTPPSGAGSQ